MSSLELDHLEDATLTEDLHHDAFSRAQHHPPTQSLAPIDGGLQALRVLLAAFMFEAILWGFPLSFGIFQEYYSTIPEFEGSPYITYIGSIATGLCYMGAPLMAPLVKSMVNEWWVARRGLSWGILLGSSGASGVAYPFIIEALLHKYGYKTTLRAMAVATVIMTGPLLPSMKGRLPASHSGGLVKTDWSFMKQPIFWLYILSTTSQSLGFYLPSLYLPSYASTAGLDSRLGAMLIALMNVSSVAGQFTYGYLSDGRIPLNMLLLSTMLVSTVVALTLWGLAKSLVTLVIFALVYGFFAYAFLAMRVRMGTAVAAEQSDTMIMFCLFSFAQGIGNVLAGPISGMLLTPDVAVHEYGYGKYKTLIVFTGAAMFTSAIFAGLAHLVPAKRNTR
ncbi:MFS general substrate transporter [Aureobasidium subglaciale]|nr:MFS general substrate transporter [Aureobasidium subglaciale]KAI5268783.1 MFS general substrate transporter [Aureobasidium subglaciale]